MSGTRLIALVFLLIAALELSEGRAAAQSRDSLLNGALIAAPPRAQRLAWHTVTPYGIPI